MAVIPYDTKSIREKLAASRAKPKTEDDKNKPNPNHRRDMADDAKHRAKVKELTAAIQDKDATLEERTKALADLQKLNEEQAAALADAQKKIAELEPVADTY